MANTEFFSIGQYNGQHVWDGGWVGVGGMCICVHECVCVSARVCACMYVRT